MSKHVLIVDDEVEILDLMERFLRCEGYYVERAVSGREAIAKMEKRLFNIVICDIRLPDIDGKELIPLLKNHNPLCNVVMITGYTSMDNVVACLGGGATDYFTKPFNDMAAVIHVIKELSGKIERWKRATPIAARM